MKILVFLFFLFFQCAAQAKLSFPTRPIKIIVYTKPGGAIDIFVRKFQVIAKKYSDAEFLIINRPGAGGILALNKLISSSADGHTLAAVTKSNIGKILSSGSSLKLDYFDWLALMVSDPEAIITNSNYISSWQELVRDSLAHGQDQIWVGPASGGNDHIMAMKTWEMAKLKAKWIPYAGGGKAMAALMGNHGKAYVGNPGDVLGRPSLKVVAVSSEKRLAAPFDGVPTFKELGFEGLDREIMWRGFIARRGISEISKSFYRELFLKVSKDPEWLSYIKGLGANPVYLSGRDFKNQVEKDKSDFQDSFKKLGKKISTQKKTHHFFLILPFLLGFLLISYKVNNKTMTSYGTIFLFVTSFYLLSYSYHYSGDVVLMPRLWSGILVLLTLLQMWKERRGYHLKEQFSGAKNVFWVIALSFFFICSTPWLGYFFASFIFLFSFLSFLRWKGIYSRLMLSSLWLIFSYFLFYRFLQIQLPLGLLFDGGAV